ncbi:MAG: polysaccharide export protein [Syntrophaceae bacterium]|nr:polysaccharide export protein [Syntrophaceae bacterium]
MNKLDAQKVSVMSHSRFYRNTINALSIVLLIVIGAWIVAIMASNANAQKDYVVAPEDKITIIVWGHDDLKRELAVSLNGNISFPLIGEIKVAGKTGSQIEKEIENKLADGYIVNPQVTVTISTISAKEEFFIMGEVKNPGKYEMKSGMNVLNAITIGGGLTPKAAPNRTKIVRVIKGKQTETRVGMDTPVKSGDTIIVPESFF